MGESPWGGHEATAGRQRTEGTEVRGEIPIVRTEIVYERPDGRTRLLIVPRFDTAQPETHERRRTGAMRNTHMAELRELLRNGCEQPQEVKGVSSPKPNGVGGNWTYQRRA